MFQKGKNKHMYNQGDKVRYVGQRFAQEFGKKAFRSGEVVAQVQNERGVYVVEFGEDSYVMKDSSLIPFVPSKKDLEAASKEAEVIVNKKRRRGSDEDSE
jgi:hypothetical protein